MCPHPISFRSWGPRRCQKRCGALAAPSDGGVPETSDRVNERHACCVLQLARATFRYDGHREQWTELRMRMHEIAQTGVHFGNRMPCDWSSLSRPFSPYQFASFPLAQNLPGRPVLLDTFLQQDKQLTVPNMPHTQCANDFLQNQIGKKHAFSPPKPRKVAHVLCHITRGL